jgi:cell division protein FtsB
LNDNQVAANNLLRTDVQDLKTGLEAVEEHARLDLGLIKPNETFVQVSTAPTTHSNY